MILYHSLLYIHIIAATIMIGISIANTKKLIPFIY